MATAAQIKTLIKSFSNKDTKKFFSTVLQVAAREEAKGHKKFAEELRALVQEPEELSSQLKSPKVHSFRKVGISSEKAKEAESLLRMSSPDVRLSSMVLNEDTENEIKKVIVEYRQKNRLSKYSLTPRRKILLVGPPGTGKT